MQFWDTYPTLLNAHDQQKGCTMHKNGYLYVKYYLTESSLMCNIQIHQIGHFDQRQPWQIGTQKSQSPPPAKKGLQLAFEVGFSSGNSLLISD